MASTPTVKPTPKAVKTYYAALKTYAEQGVENELAVRSAFQNLLDETRSWLVQFFSELMKLSAENYIVCPAPSRTKGARFPACQSPASAWASLLLA